jgi:hypothetical protein
VSSRTKKEEFSRERKENFGLVWKIKESWIFFPLLIALFSNFQDKTFKDWILSEGSFLSRASFLFLNSKVLKLSYYLLYLRVFYAFLSPNLLSVTFKIYLERKSESKNGTKGSVSWGWG